MTKINFLRNDSMFDDYIKNLSKECELESINNNDIQNTLFKGPLIVRVQKENINEVLELLEDRHEKVVVAFKEKSDFKLMNDLKSQLDKIFGFLDLTLDFDYNIPLVKNYMNQNFSTSTIPLEKLSKDLEKIFEYTQTELSRVKQLHDRFVKLRTEKLRGGQIQIKFMAGEKSGGEFFDFLERDNYIYVFTAGTDSYVTSSLIISEIEATKAIDGNISQLIPNLTKKIVDIAEENKSKLNYLITVFNMSTLDVDYYQRGNSKVYNGEQILNISGDGKFKLHRGEKLFFLSEGLVLNWNLSRKESELKDFLNAHKDLNNKDFINELFFELVKKKTTVFLQHDALMGLIEIDQNIIHKV